MAQIRMSRSRLGDPYGWLHGQKPSRAVCQAGAQIKQVDQQHEYELTIRLLGRRDHTSGWR